MLSILIPTYNYPIKLLIEGLGHALKHIEFDVEILCLEDGSTEYVSENAHVCANLKQAEHIISELNQGRISSRRHLSAKAKYQWLLFLDADVEIRDNLFLKYYSKYLTSNYDAIYGGCSYDPSKPNSDELLRWKYGKTYEDIDAKIRNKAPYKHTVSANFLIKKDIIIFLYSKIEYEGYGYDILLGSIMESEAIKVAHINNPIIHKGLDKNKQFLTKVRSAVENSYKLQRNNSYQFQNSSLIKIFKKLKKLKLIRFVGKLFELTKVKMERNLLGSEPSIQLLQFYKLGYLCTLSSKS